MRPHYHLALYGEFDLYQDEQLNHQCDVIKESWTLGHVHIGLLTTESAGYLTRYTLKRLTRPDDQRLEGKKPEFALMSTRPGIGQKSVLKMADGLLDRKGSALMAKKGDVPSEFIVHGKRYYLGRYLQNELRSETGRDKGTPRDMQLKFSENKLRQDRKVRESVRRQHARIAANRVKHQSLKGKI